MSKPTIGFFHVALMEGLGGLTVAAEMHGRLLSSGLYAATDKIVVSILGDVRQAEHLVDYVFSRYDKYQVAHVSENLREWEWPTLASIKNVCSRVDCDVWYVHTKGASNCRPDVPGHIQRNIRNWRGVMCHDVMDQHDVCKYLLKEYDAVGPLLYDGNEHVPHFVGNFWWTKSSHVAKLAPVSGTLIEGRADAEAWVTRAEGKYKGLSALRVYDCYDFQGVFSEKGVFYGMKGADA